MPANILLRRLTVSALLGFLSLHTAADETALTLQMAAGHAGDRPDATPAALTAPAQPVVSETVRYGELDGEALYGYLARPANGGEERPAIIVIHEWWGLNDNIRQMTERLAGEGYVALAVDLYQGESATEVRAAMQLSQALSANLEQGDRNLRAAWDYLEESAGAPRIAAIGWCLGGRWTLRAALQFPDELAAAVIYYGSVRAEEAELATLQMPILGIFAGLDRVVPVRQVEQFAATMEELGKPLELHMYPDADHAFANPSGGVYDAAAAEDAWQRTVDFLARTLGRR